MKQLAGLIAADAGPLPLASDGRIDVYEIVRRKGYSGELVGDLFWSERLGVGPTPQEVGRGDYTNFPFARHRGRSADLCHVPVIWEREPVRGARVVGFIDGRVRYMEEVRFQWLAAQYGLEGEPPQEVRRAATGASSAW